MLLRDYLSRTDLADVKPGRTRSESGTAFCCLLILALLFSWNDTCCSCSVCKHPVEDMEMQLIRSAVFQKTRLSTRNSTGLFYRRLSPLKQNFSNSCRCWDSDRHVLVWLSHTFNSLHSRRLVGVNC